MVHIYGSYMLHIEFFFCSTPPQKKSPALKRVHQAVDPLYFMSYVIHLRRLWVILALGLRSLDFLAWKCQARSFRAPPWSSGKWGVMWAMYVFLVDFWSFKNHTKESWAFLLVFCKANFFTWGLRVFDFWLRGPPLKSDIAVEDLSNRFIGGISGKTKTRFAH